MKLCHIINPVNVSKSSDLYVAQPITFESLRVAKNFSNPTVKVSLLTAQYEEDCSQIPHFFTKTPNLSRSVIDVAAQPMKRKLPLVADILSNAYEATTKGDYIIFTNVDIAVQPYFYDWVAATINEGYDAFVINRRTISNCFTKTSELSKMYAEWGTEHPGYDCFVMKRSVIPKLELDNICVGAVFIGLTLFTNLSLKATNFREFGKEHLTFHIGNDQVWKEESNNPYKVHNKKAFERVKENLRSTHPDLHQVLKSSFPNLRKESSTDQESLKAKIKRYIKFKK